MAREIDVYDVMTFALLKGKEVVSIDEIQRFCKDVMNQLSDCIMEYHKGKIYENINNYNRFKLDTEDDKLVMFADEFNYEKEIKRYEYILPLKIVDVFKKTPLHVIL